MENIESFELDPATSQVVARLKAQGVWVATMGSLGLTSDPDPDTPIYFDGGRYLGTLAQFAPEYMDGRIIFYGATLEYGNGQVRHLVILNEEAISDRSK